MKMSPKSFRFPSRDEIIGWGLGLSLIGFGLYFTFAPKIHQYTLLSAQRSKQASVQAEPVPYRRMKSSFSEAMNKARWHEPRICEGEVMFSYQGTSSEGNTNVANIVTIPRQRCEQMIDTWLEYRSSEGALYLRTWRVPHLAGDPVIQLRPDLTARLESSIHPEGSQ